jgi:hypothetical protein
MVVVTELGAVIQQRLALAALVVVMVAVRVLFIQAVQQRLGKEIMAALAAAPRMVAVAVAVLEPLEVAQVEVARAM